MEKLLREAFRAGYNFTLLKKDGGKGIGFDEWYNSIKTQQQVKLFAISDVNNLVCYKECGNTQPSGGSDNICLSCGSSIRQTDC